MIQGIGIDLVELSRITSWTQDKFIERILSDDEKMIFDSITSEDRKLTFIGGRFAAKEALFKAFFEGDKTANYKDFSILNDLNGKPYVISKHQSDKMTIHISITHTKDYAMAYVVIETL
ncbi:MAG: holo-[acyl-carrier-protein] synthase [Acholeplasma sp.]|jgi:holo-[acyl-carrier protein] synthase|nr:MAG: holo-[acyl-carrier-protein] synthase [Acholeplasma sp.]